MPQPRLDHLLALLDRLDQQGATYQVFHRRRSDSAMSVDVAAPGSRWEIDYLDDGSVDVEVFRSDGAVNDEARLDELYGLLD